MTMNFMREETVDHSQKLTEEVAMFALLDHALVQAREAETAKRYEGRAKSVGAGRVGHPMAPVPYNRGCERALYYEWKQYPNDRPFSASLYRIFAMGHQGEEIVAENLRLAGFELLTHDNAGNQFGFALSPDPETGQPRYKGFCDGVLVNGPARIGGAKDGVNLKYPMLWENKMLNNSKFNKFVAEGVESSHPMYYGQIQSYMNFLQLYQNPALLTCVNRDTGDLRVEFVRFQHRHTQAIIDRAARVVEAQGPLVLERAAKDYTKVPCKWCPYQNSCKRDEENRPQVGTADFQQAPEWLNKGDNQ